MKWIIALALIGGAIVWLYGSHGDQMKYKFDAARERNARHITEGE